MANELEDKHVQQKTKIKPIAMQTARLLQAVVLLLIVALAASCAATKEYTSKLFAPRSESSTDTQAVTLRFLNTDSADAEEGGWVTTDIIMGRDTSDRTTVLDNFAKVYPPVKTPVVTKDTTKKAIDTISIAGVPAVNEEKVLARTTAQNAGIREKKSRE